jgi:hypothetical protein
VCVFAPELLVNVFVLSVLCRALGMCVCVLSPSRSVCVATMFLHENGKSDNGKTESE